MGRFGGLLVFCASIVTHKSIWQKYSESNSKMDRNTKVVVNVVAFVVIVIWSVVLAVQMWTKSKEPKVTVTATTAQTLAPIVTPHAEQEMVGPIATATETEAVPVSNPAPVVQVETTENKTANMPVLPSDPWKCLAGVHVPIRRNSKKDIECLSKDGQTCAMATTDAECGVMAASATSDAKVVACGGKYEDPTSWCAKANAQLL